MPRAVLGCPVCDQLNAIGEEVEKTTFRCDRCGYVLRAIKGGPGTALPWALTSAILFLTLFWLPLVGISKMGIDRHLRLFELGGALRKEGMALVGWLVDGCLVLAPVGLLAGIFFLSVAMMFRMSPPGWGMVITLVEWSRRWAMLEVLILAVLLSFLKIGALARASFEMGFPVLLASTVALLLAQQAFDVGEARRILSQLPSQDKQGGPSVDSHAHGHHHLSLQPSWALLIAAGIALIPANVLPIMDMKIGSTTSSSTIFGGIILLAEEHMWGIALIVFLASFMVPIVKLGGLAVLLVQGRKATGTSRSLRLHGWIDFIGRWSMLDVLLIGVLAALIQFGSLAQVHPGLGAASFAAAVVLTIFAVEAFPLRRLFHARDNLA